MTKYKNVAVIDIGKTNAKLAVVGTENWTEIAVRKISNAVLDDGPYPHFDTDKIWNFLLNSLREVHTLHGVDAISITTHGAAVALLDQSGQLAFPVLDYEYTGVDSSREEYDRIRPDFSETGSPSLAGGLNIGAQIYWLETQFPSKFSEVQTILMYPQYWAFRLSGVAANEVTSLGCHTDLWQPGSGSYSDIVRKRGWLEKMAPLRSAFECLGPLVPSIAEETGLPNHTPVYCGIHDSNASLLPYVLRSERPLSVVSSGTWVIVMTLGASVEGLNPAMDTLVNVDALGSPVPTVRFMGGRDFEELLGSKSTEPTPEEIESALSSGVRVLPASHEQKPRWSANADALSKGEKTTLVSVFLAEETAARLNLIRAQGTIYVEGPFCKNGVFTSQLAALTNRSVKYDHSSSTGTAVGTAMLTIRQH
ncbi:MAG: FGGY family carbohydrate kinase [Paracoccaceae bacterium]|jgi:sugar (pentulose or hexulose) kinase